MSNQMDFNQSKSGRTELENLNSRLSELYQRQREFNKQFKQEWKVIQTLRAKETHSIEHHGPECPICTSRNTKIRS